MALPNDSLEYNTRIDPDSGKDLSGQNGTKQFWLNILSCALIAITVGACFHKTVFQAAPISRLYQLGQRDTLFAKYFTAQREGYDASVYQYFIPSHHFTIDNLRKGVIPLWNPLAGCGEPFLADIETAPFWPLRLTMLFMEPLRSWNLLIVFNLVTFAIGTFILGLSVNLRRFAAIFAGLVCAFCPFLIFQSELIGSSSSVIPFVIAAFIFAEKKNSLPSKILAGAACAWMIVSGHPEPSFFGISCASLIYILLRTMNWQSTLPLWRRALFSLLDIALIGIFAFGFSAPILFPFAELLKNSDCYKLGLTGHRPGVPLNSILINLIHPAYEKCSPFLGVIALPLIIAGGALHFRSDLYPRVFALSAIILIAMMSQLGPLDWLMNLNAFSWFVPKYCYPALLVVLSVMSGFGMQFIVDGLQKDWKKSSYWIVGSAAIVLAGLIAIRFYPALLDCIRQDEGFDHLAVMGKLWTRDIIILTVFAILMVASKLFGKLKAAVCVLAVCICSVLSIAPVAKMASPISPVLQYDPVDPIPFLQEKKERIVTMGRHIFCPSSNFVYGINNIVPVNVYHPTGFLSFLQKCGITPEGVNQFFDDRLSPSIDLAAVKYVVSALPVLSSKEELAPTLPLKNNKVVAWEGNQASLSGAAIEFRPQNREIIGTLKFKVSPQRAKQLGVQMVVLDSQDKVIWYGDPERLLYLFAKDNRSSLSDVEHTVRIPLPADLQKGKFAIQLFDWEKIAYVPLQKESQISDKNNSLLLLGEIENSSPALKSELLDALTLSSNTETSPFRLRTETASHVRVYENTRAKPYCYIRSAKKERSAAIGKVQWSRPDSNSIKIDLDSASPGNLVISELFQNGWQASIERNGQSDPVAIEKVDEIFLSVPVPQGKSTVTLTYQPVSFISGVVVFFLTVFISALIFFASRPALYKKTGLFNSSKKQSSPG